MTPDELTTRGLRVKPLEFEDMGGGFMRAPGPLFGSIRIDHYSKRFEVTWSVPGITDTLVHGEFPTQEAAIAAANAHHAAQVAAMIEVIE